jgi:hypothetical protein
MFLAVMIRQRRTAGAAPHQGGPSSPKFLPTDRNAPSEPLRLIVRMHRRASRMPWAFRFASLTTPRANVAGRGQLNLIRL